MSARHRLAVSLIGCPGGHQPSFVVVRRDWSSRPAAAAGSATAAAISRLVRTPCRKVARSASSAPNPTHDEGGPAGTARSPASGAVRPGADAADGPAVDVVAVVA